MVVCTYTTPSTRKCKWHVLYVHKYLIYFPEPLKPILVMGFQTRQYLYKKFTQLKQIYTILWVESAPPIRCKHLIT